MIETVGVLGGGAWGTALALVAARAGRRVRLWARDPATVAAIDTSHENPRHLPGIRLDHIPATSSIAVALRADMIVLAVPAQAVRGVASIAAPYLAHGVPLVVAAKGIERATGKRMTEVVAEAAPESVPAMLSGPSFATDVARGLPTAVTIAAHDEAVAMALCHALGSQSFRPYAETDVTGVEIGGAVKNVLAIAAGIVSGRGLGASALAATIARGFAELRRLGEAIGARPETLMGLSGLGDLVLTASSVQSRNFAYGRMVGEAGGDVPAPTVLVEGIETAFVTRDLARKLHVPMPIVEAVAAVLSRKLTVDAAVEGLMARPIRREAG
ncbi:MAG: NAD(P)-dependent glycerol-3-phosphate dehydrogenase [Rhizobiales bacterium]|nr:NAD(P)-dependent glycerol-3-phosphate dehydrogenase [Hyphomicrobiales bacterium]